jgi:hypothetical protein
MVHAKVQLPYSTNYVNEIKADGRRHVHEGFIANCTLWDQFLKRIHISSTRFFLMPAPSKQFLTNFTQKAPRNRTTARIIS